MQPRSHCLLITATILILALTATHRHITSVVAATTPHPVLIELFTSEGCSSCPPADTLLRQINGMHTDTGQLIVGVSEHVTYWNNLGWNDPYSTSTFTDRQNSYGMRFHLDSVYTPQIVVNGERQVLGSDRSAVLRAVQETDHPSQLKVQIVSTTVSGDTLTISYAIRETSSSEGADLFAILADDVDTSNVLRGENSGRTITHVSVARNLTHIGTIHDGTENVIQLPLANTRHSAQHLILFAQAKHLGPVLSVDTAPLN